MSWRLPAWQRPGLKNVLVTNGYINPEPLAALLPYLDGVNLDLKGRSVSTKNIVEEVLPRCSRPPLSLLAMSIWKYQSFVAGENDQEENLAALVRFYRQP